MVVGIELLDHCFQALFWDKSVNGFKSKLRDTGKTGVSAYGMGRQLVPSYSHPIVCTSIQCLVKGIHSLHVSKALWQWAGKFIYKGKNINKISRYHVQLLFYFCLLVDLRMEDFDIGPRLHTYRNYFWSKEIKFHLNSEWNIEELSKTVGSAFFWTWNFNSLLSLTLVWTLFQIHGCVKEIVQSC